MRYIVITMTELQLNCNQKMLRHHLKSRAKTSIAHPLVVLWKIVHLSDKEKCRITLERT